MARLLALEVRPRDVALHRDSLLDWMQQRLRLPVARDAAEAQELLQQGDLAEEEVRLVHLLHRLHPSDRKGVEIFWLPGIRLPGKNAGVDYPRALIKVARSRLRAIWFSQA